MNGGASQSARVLAATVRERGHYFERLGHTRTITVWRVTSHSVTDGCHLIDAGDAASVEQAVTRALSHCQQGDLLLVVDQDTGTRTHVVHPFKVQFNRARQLMKPDPLPAFPVVMIGLVPPFDALRDCPTGRDATLVEMK